MAAAKNTDEIARARDSYARHAWADAHRGFAAADAGAPLAGRDLELYAIAAGLTAHDDDYLALMDRLYQGYLDGGERTRAAHWAFWLGFRLAGEGEMGRAGGWLARAQRLVENVDCVERGYLLLPTVHRLFAAGDHTGARAAAGEAAAIGDRFGDADLSAFARCLEGRALLRQGQVERGLALLDEAMVAVTTGGLGPILTGLTYCSAIASCSQLYMMDRAREWTAALASWCAAQPDLVPFSGTCLVHRAELMQLAGSWREAIDEARRASERVSRRIDRYATADAFYQQAEVHRLRGDFTAAERDYRSASELGREAQPGLALLRFAQGRRADAVNAIRGALSATSDRLHRARLLPASIEISLAVGDVDDARRASDELGQIAVDFGTEVLGAMAAHARGAVALADGYPDAALEPLRRAFRVWHEVGAPYIAARLRVLIAHACAALGDRDTAALERGLAREVFEGLGAMPDLTSLDGGDTPGTQGAVPARLSPRELQVLRLIASGKTNKVIAKELFLSEKTIDRHVSNIFAKANVASRAAATAFAYQHGLV
jgi:ATP/maltotriose-dependent transcriptional regulator MalT